MVGQRRRTSHLHGAIRTQTARVIDKSTQSSHAIDARSYSLRTLDNVPTTGERVAYHTAKIIQHDQSIRDLITNLTGMTVAIFPVPSQHQQSVDPTRSIMVYFTGGILVTEDLASPASKTLLTFQSKYRTSQHPPPSFVTA